jgi:hypothetical protein
MLIWNLEAPSVYSSKSPPHNLMQMFCLLPGGITQMPCHGATIPNWNYIPTNCGRAYTATWTFFFKFEWHSTTIAQRGDCNLSHLLSLAPVLPFQRRNWCFQRNGATCQIWSWIFFWAGNVTLHSFIYRNGVTFKQW